MAFYAVAFMYSIKKFSIFWKLSGKLGGLSMYMMIPGSLCTHKCLERVRCTIWALISQTYVEHLFMQDASLVAAIS